MEEETEEQQSAAASSQKTVLSSQSTKTGCAPIAASTTSTTTTRVSVVAADADATAAATAGSDAVPVDSSDDDDDDDDDGADIGVVANVVTTTVKETTPPASVASSASVAASSSSSPAVKKIITTTTTTTTTTIAATTGDDDDDDDKVVVYNTTTSNERQNRSASAKKKRFRNSNLNRPCGGSSSSPSSSSTTTGRTASLTASMNSSNNNTLTYQSGSVSTLGSRSSGGGGGVAAAAAAASPRAYSRKKSNGSSRNSAASSRSSGSSDSNASASPAALSPPAGAAAAEKGSPSSSSSWLMEHRRAEVDRHKRLLAQRIREHAIGLREEQELAQQIRRAEADLQRAAALAQQRQQQQQQQDAQSSTSNSSGFLNNQKHAAAAAGKRPTDLQQQRQETAPRSAAAAAAATTTVTSAVVGRRGGQPEMSNKSTNDNGSSALNDQKPSSSSSSKTALLDPTTADAASGTSSTSSTAGLTTTAAAATSPSTTTTNAGAKPGAYRVSGFNYFGSCSTLDTTGLDTINDDDENQPRPITAVSSLQATLLPEQQEQSVSSASAAAIAPTAAAAAAATTTTLNANNNPDNNILCAELVDEDAMQLRAEQQAAVALQRMMDQAPVAQAMADDDVVDSRARRLAQRKKKRMRKCIVTWTILVVVMVNITVAAVVAYGMGFFDNIVNTGGQNDDSSSPPNPETTSSSFWNQIGSNIDGVQASEAFGAALGISADGNTLVASAPRFLGGGGSGDGMNTTGSIGHVRAYRYHAQDDEWKRLGQDLEGRLPNEKFGNRLSLSPNGKLLAIASSSSSAGVVRIFGLSETNNDSANRSANEEESVDVWGQFGLDIVSPHNSSSFGQSLSIMDNFVLAIGDVAYPTTSMNVTNDDDRGRVLMFQFNTSQREWVTMGAEINAARSATAFGQSLQLAMDKNGILVLAVGELHQNVDDDDDDAPVGHVSMYRYDQAVDSWIPFGADFQGDGEFGATVALSADGSMLVVGEAPMKNDTTTTSGRNSTGIVIFLHNETATDDWTRIGMDVEGAEEGQSERGSFLALSADGKVLATTFRHIESGFGQVLIWDFIANQDGSGTWSQRGPALQTTNNGGMFDFRVALSALGDRVAVSNVVASNEAGVETGHLQVFESDPIAGPLPGCCQAFSTTLELQAAVSDYLIATVEDGRKVTLVKAKYGEKIGEWDVSSISSFEYLFDAERTPEAATFNEDVSSWNVGKAKRMTGMFRGASSFNQDLSSWNVSHVEDMVSMFQDAIALNQSLCSWGLLLDASIVNVAFAFANATSCPRTKDPDLVNNSPPGPFCAVCKP